MTSAPVTPSTPRSAAPGRLESVRALLNSWRIPDDTRVPVDVLDDLAADPDAWSAQLPALPRPHPRQLPALRSLREELRSALQQPTRLDTLLAHAALRLRYHPDQPGRLRHEAGDPSSTSDAILGAVADAITSGDWPRLKACRDCRWVFYDHSKNTSRTWCSMTAQGGRACGSIAKTRTYRQRQKGQDPIDL